MRSVLVDRNVPQKLPKDCKCPGCCPLAISTPPPFLQLSCALVNGPTAAGEAAHCVELILVKPVFTMLTLDLAACQDKQCLLRSGGLS